MTELLLDKLIFAKSKKYEEPFFFTAYAFDVDGKDITIQGLSTPELNQV